MIRSMFSAISGLRANRTMLDVVGNNIANSGTNGFKGSSTVFEDVLSQTIKGAGASDTETGTGGTNPSQIGLGVAVSRVSTDFSQGALQATGRELDFALQGDGFFTIDSAGERLYTRAGSMSLDAEGNLVTSGGAMIQGWAADATGTIDANLGVSSVNIPIGKLAPPSPTTTVDLAGNLPADAAVNDTFISSVEVYAPDGATEVIALTFEKTAASEWTVTGTYGPSPGTAFTMTDNVVQFDAAGDPTDPTDFSIDIAAGQIPGFDAMEIMVDNGSNKITQYGELETLSVLGQDGFGAGTLQAMSISQEGVLVGSYSNGLNRPIAQLAVAQFANPGGLEKTGGSAYRASINSGVENLSAAGNGGRGLIASGTLEASNVDLAEEFVKLIQAQRGFQANSRVITTSDEVLSEIVNLKR